MRKCLSMCLGLGLLGALIGCASKLTPVKISSSADINEELSYQHRMIEAGYTHQVDVLAADDFNEARDYFSKAKRLNNKGSSSKDIFVPLGYSKAYLEQASKNAQAATLHLGEVTKARQHALLVGARNFPKQLKDIDDELDAMSSTASGNVPVDEKLALQSKYLALELICIKANKIGAVEKILIEAKKDGAEKTTPKAYAEAVRDFHIASKLIETDRHSDLPIQTAANTAMVSAKRVLSLMASENTSRKQTPEQRAMDLEARDNAVKKANSQTFQVQADSMEKDQVLVEQKQMMLAQSASQTATEEENTALKRTESDEKMVSDAAAQFTKAEAEVYRQNGVLIIRLKSMHFAPGRSDLPSDAMTILAKVKAIILQLNAGAVAVQGHTDSLGHAKSNQILSEKRAESVMKYFATGEEMESNKLSSVGFGYSKPLATNKTKEGRSQNRRVDVLITTSQAQ